MVLNLPATNATDKASGGWSLLVVIVRTHGGSTNSLIYIPIWIVASYVLGKPLARCQIRFLTTTLCSKPPLHLLAHQGLLLF